MANVTVTPVDAVAAGAGTGGGSMGFTSPATRSWP